jgi:hypothetical protein
MINRYRFSPPPFTLSNKYSMINYSLWKISNYPLVLFDSTCSLWYRINACSYFLCYWTYWSSLAAQIKKINYIRTKYRIRMVCVFVSI